MQMPPIAKKALNPLRKCDDRMGDWGTVTRVVYFVESCPFSLNRRGNHGGKSAMRMTIGRKMLVGFLLVAGLTAATGWVAISKLNSVGIAMDAVTDEAVPVADFSMELTIALLSTQEIATEYAAKGTGLDEVAARLDKALARFDELLASEVPFDQVQLDIVAAVRETRDEYVSAVDAVMQAHREEMDARAEAETLAEQVDALAKKAVDALVAAGMGMHEYMLLSDQAMALNEYLTTSSPEEIKNFDALDAQVRALPGYEAIAEAHAAFVDAARRCIAAQTRHLQSREAMENGIDALDAVSAEMERLLHDLWESASEAMAASTDTVDSVHRSAVRAVTGMCGIAVALGVIIALVVSTAITKPIGRMADVAARIAAGDLSMEHIEVRTDDEIGDLAASFNRMIDGLNEALLAAASTSEQVASAAQEVAASSEQMAAGTQEQTSQASAVASAVQEMSATVLQVAKNASSASENSRNASDTAQEGGNIVEQTVAGIRAIAESTQIVANVIDELGRRSEEIGQIIGVIDDIADQTNLLALNAAIEAARAGEQGRGFAVVADEVRKLAERTTSATKEVGATIKAIQDDTQNAVQAMERGMQEVQQGTELAGQAGEALRRIVESVDRVASMIQQIATAADEQSAAAEEIAKNVDGISSITRQTAAGAQQASAAAQQLSANAETLRQLVGRFKLRRQAEETASAEA